MLLILSSDVLRLLSSRFRMLHVDARTAAAAVAFRSIVGQERFLPRMAKREQSGVVKKHPFQGRTAPRQPSESNLQATLVVL